jgi:hypothetical protein
LVFISRSLDPLVPGQHLKKLSVNWELMAVTVNFFVINGERKQWKADVNLSATPCGRTYLKIPSSKLDALLHAEQSETCTVDYPLSCRRDIKPNPIIADEKE